MAEKNRTCIICGTKYTWCNNCSDNAKKGETWRSIYCSENCMKIFDILSGYTFKHINDQQAKDKLKNVDLSKLESFRSDFKEQVKKIQSAQAQPQHQPQPEQQKQNHEQPKQNNDSKPQNQQLNKEKEIVKQDFKK